MTFLRNGSGGVAGRLVAAAVAVVLVLGTVVAVASLIGDDAGSPSAGDPKVLTLTRTSTGLQGSAGLVLATDLPTDHVEGVVLDPSGSSVTRAEVVELLDSLGLDAEPVEVDGGWTAEGRVRGEPAAFALDERAGNVWQFATGAAAKCLSVVPGGSPDDAVSSCTAVSDGDSGTGSGPGRAALIDEAGDVFAVVGVEPGEGLRALEGGGVTSLDVPLVVEGLPVVGVTLSVSVDDEGLTSALGWLRPDLRPLGAYPLVTAPEAFTELADQPVQEPAICQLPTDAKGRPDQDAPCVTPTPAKVTAARLAWLPSFDGARNLLVPAWQFEADGFYGPAVVALAPEYVDSP